MANRGAKFGAKARGYCLCSAAALDLTLNHVLHSIPGRPSCATLYDTSSMPIEVCALRIASIQPRQHLRNVSVGGLAFASEVEVPSGAMVSLRIPCVSPVFESEAKGGVVPQATARAQGGVSRSGRRLPRTHDRAGVPYRGISRTGAPDRAARAGAQTGGRGVDSVRRTVPRSGAADPPDASVTPLPGLPAVAFSLVSRSGPSASAGLTFMVMRAEDLLPVRIEHVHRHHDIARRNEIDAAVGHTRAGRSLALVGYSTLMPLGIQRLPAGMLTSVMVPVTSSAALHMAMACGAEVIGDFAAERQPDFGVARFELDERVDGGKIRRHLAYHLLEKASCRRFGKNCRAWLMPISPENE